MIGDSPVIIDQPNCVQYWNLIDTDLLDYYHMMHVYRYTIKNMHYTNLPRSTAHGLSMAHLLNVAIFGPPGICKCEGLDGLHTITRDVDHFRS